MKFFSKPEPLIRNNVPPPTPMPTGSGRYRFEGAYMPDGSTSTDAVFYVQVQGDPAVYSMGDTIHTNPEQAAVLRKRYVLVEY